MNGKITITKERYQELRQKAERFEIIRKLAFEDQELFQEPPTKNIPKIIRELEKTGRYTKTFIKSLASGLKKSGYFSK